MFAFGASSSFCNSFSMLFIQLPFLLYSLRSHICSKIMLYPCHLVIGMSSCILPLLSGITFLLIWSVLFCLYCFILSLYLSFPSTFWFTSSSCIICFTSCVVFFFSSQNVPMFYFYLILFACCPRFLTCISSQISHPGFESLCSLVEARFYLRLISLQRRLVSLISSCFSLSYVFAKNSVSTK